MSDIPDWNSFGKSMLDHALQGLPVPIPGPAPHGIFLQEAIKVSPLTHAYDIVYDIVPYMKYGITYMISYMISCMMY